MQGGTISVAGNAEDFAGAAYVGSARGMNGGTILIDGDVGREAGARMRRGVLAVGGSACDLFGVNMLAGTLVAIGACGRHPGAGMRRGTIWLLDAARPDLLPTFLFSCQGQPVALNLVQSELRKLGFFSESFRTATQFDLYRGDMLELGKGEIYVSSA